MIEIRRELHPVNQDKRVASFGCVYSSHPTYVSNRGRAMVEIRRGIGVSQMWRSEDNGDTWELADEIFQEEALPDGTFAEWTLGPFFHDSSTDALIRFRWSRLFTRPPSQLNGYHDFVKAHIAESYRVYYEISRDGGRTWDKLRQFIEYGPEFDGEHWAQGVRFLQGAAVLGSVPPFHPLPDGMLMLPCQRRTAENAAALGSIQAGRFFGTWRSDGADIDWVTGGTVPGGGCEQTIERLQDGRLLNIIRVQGQVVPYYFDVWRRPYSLSDDEGRTWSVPRPLMWDDGTEFTTPRAWSQLIRSTGNGRLYWVANILPASGDAVELQKRWPGRADPRYPLQIVEIDEETLTLKRDTVTVIEDRQPGETPYVRFSNFYAYNDRCTDEIILLMMKSYHEDQEDLANMPHPAYRYRIRVPRP